MTDPGELREAAARTGHLRERWEIFHREIAPAFFPKLHRDEELWHAHRLVDENLFLALVAIAPDHDRLEADHRRLEIEHRLDKERILQRRKGAFRGAAFRGRLFPTFRRHLTEIVTPNLHQRYRRRGEGSGGILHRPSLEKIVHALQPRLAQNQRPEQGDDEEKPGRGTAHWRRN